MSRTDPVEVEQHEHATWEASAEIYVDAIGFMTALSGQLEIALEVGEVDRASRVLDVGCGPGLLSTALAERAGKVEGVDFSEKMIAAARKLAPELKFQVANAEHLPYPESCFDVAICCNTAHHFARPRTVFTEILRVLKPGGRIVVIHPIQSEQASFGSFADALYESLPPEQVPGGPLLDVSNPNDYELLLQDCGYVNVRCQRRRKPVELDDISALLDAGWKIANLSEQPNDVQAKIREATITKAAKFQRPGGGYSFPDVVLVASGHQHAKG